MANPFLKYLISGATNPKGNVASWQHAARLFVDDNLRLAPKSKYNFHVVFSINTDALKNLNLNYKHRNEINMLVKKVDLPKFTVATETLNQYNRKKVVQSKIDYQPVSISFHDDNLGITRALWENYYSYYYADPIAAKISGAYNRTAMAAGSYIRSPYGFDNNSSIPFFSKITIYQMARRTWQSYTLVNPLITTWNHDTMDYSQGASTSENTMTVAYESVAYDAGLVQAGTNPPGFGGPDHYDTVPSPLTIAGGGTRSIFGVGGVLAGVSQVAGALSTGTAFDSPGNFISTAITAVNTYNNSKGLSSAGVRQELGNIAVRGLNTLATQGPSGIRDIAFPIANTISNVSSTVARISNLFGR